MEHFSNLHELLCSSHLLLSDLMARPPLHVHHLAEEHLVLLLLLREARFLSWTDSRPGPWGRFELLLTLRGCLPGRGVVGWPLPAVRASVSGGSTGSGDRVQPTITAISSPAPRSARIALLVCGIGQRSGLSGPLGVAVTEAVVSRCPLVC